MRLKAACCAVLFVHAVVACHDASRPTGEAPRGSSGSVPDVAVAPRPVVVPAASEAAATSVADAPPDAARGESPETIRSEEWTIRFTHDRVWAEREGGAPWTIFPRSPPHADCYEEHSGQVLSVVGPIVSYYAFHAAECAHAAHPSEVTAFYAVDLRKIANHEVDPSASLFEYFERAEVEEALASDPFLKRFRDADSPCEYSLYSYDTHWAVYEKKGARVGIRLGLPHGCEVMRGRLTQIGLLLTPKPAFQQPIDLAAKAGHLMASLAPNVTRSNGASP